MYGFRERLGTHDVLLQLHELAIKRAKNQTPRAILAPHLKGASDNATHASILHNLNNTGCDEKIVKYTNDFLSNPTAVIKTSQETSQPTELGDRRTPQGSVLLPMLFNLALLPLPAILDTTGGIDHALYAGHITIWTSKVVSE
ncbi:uncharacterized protein LOC144151915 [Haemaphysalis longicornis]